MPTGATRVLLRSSTGNLVASGLPSLLYFRHWCRDWEASRCRAWAARCDDHTDQAQTESIAGRCRAQVGVQLVGERGQVPDAHAGTWQAVVGCCAGAIIPEHMPNSSTRGTRCLHARCTTHC